MKRDHERNARIRQMQEAGVPQADIASVFGISLGYWLEFVFQAFEGYTGNMILATGVPDNPASLPHSHPKRKL